MDTIELNEHQRQALLRATVPAVDTGKPWGAHVRTSRRHHAIARELYELAMKCPPGSELRKLYLRENKANRKKGKAAWREAAKQYKYDYYVLGKHGPSRTFKMVIDDLSADTLKNAFWVSAPMPYQRAAMAALQRVASQPRAVAFAPELAAPYGSGKWSSPVYRAALEKKIKDALERSDPIRCTLNGRWSGKAPGQDNLPRYAQPCRMKLFDRPNYHTGGFIPNPTPPDNKKEPTMSSITLTADSIGKSFATRDGRRVDFIARNDKPSTPIEEFIGLLHNENGTKSSYVWPASGRVLEALESHTDLIGEWKPFKVEIGGIYVTRNGRNVCIVVGRSRNCFSVRWIEGPFSAADNPFSVGYCYENGKIGKGADLPDDLVKATYPRSHEQWAAAKAYRLADELLTGKTRILEVTQWPGQDAQVSTTFNGSNFELTVRE